MALALRAEERARYRQGHIARILFALCGAGGNGRAGRHGELDRRTARDAESGRAQISFQLPARDGPGAAFATRRMARQRGDDHRGCRRAQSARLLRPLGPTDRRAMTLVDRPDALATLLLQAEVERFFSAEAELLDERRFDEWLDLLHEDIRYWMPIARNASFDRPELEYTREKSEASWFDEGKDTLRKRVAQLQSGDHWAEEP